MNVYIFGAGQAGRMLMSWCAGEIYLKGFIDNNISLQGTYVGGFPVVSPEAALEDSPDEIWLAVLNREAASGIRDYIYSRGFNGRIQYVRDITDRYDLRLSAMRLYTAEIIRRGVKGAAAELGVYKGDFAFELHKSLPGRKLYLLDTFEGFSQSDLMMESAPHKGRRDFSDTSAESVRRRFGDDEDVVIIKGHFPETAADLLNERFAFVNIDPDLYLPTLNGLNFFYPRMNKGGCIFIHDFNSTQYPGVRKAADEFCEAFDVYVLPLNDMHGTGVIIKSW